MQFGLSNSVGFFSTTWSLLYKPTQVTAALLYVLSLEFYFGRHATLHPRLLLYHRLRAASQWRLIPRYPTWLKCNISLSLYFYFRCWTIFFKRQHSFTFVYIYVWEIWNDRIWYGRVGIAHTMVWLFTIWNRKSKWSTLINTLMWGWMRGRPSRPQEVLSCIWRWLVVQRCCGQNGSWSIFFITVVKLKFCDLLLCWTTVCLRTSSPNSRNI